ILEFFSRASVIYFSCRFLPRRTEKQSAFITCGIRCTKVSITGIKRRYIFNFVAGGAVFPFLGLFAGFYSHCSLLIARSRGKIFIILGYCLVISALEFYSIGNAKQRYIILITGFYGFIIPYFLVFGIIYHTVTLRGFENDFRFNILVLLLGICLFIEVNSIIVIAFVESIIGSNGARMLCLHLQRK